MVQAGLVPSDDGGAGGTVARLGFVRHHQLRLRRRTRLVGGACALYALALLAAMLPLVRAHRGVGANSHGGGSGAESDDNRRRGLDY